MGTEPTTQDASADDQELAKALAGLNQEAPAANVADDLAFEETPAPGGSPVASAPFGTADSSQSQPAATPAPSVPPADNAVPNTLPAPEPATPAASPFGAAPVEPAAPTAPAQDNGLESIKNDALTELRPLVGKLTLPPEEKFDTYLLLLRSTDDPSLIGPAHDAAKEIPDEAQRAQALLDIIKEIDYFNHK